MNCLTTKEQTSQFLDNELHTEELQPMFHHLSECEECRIFFIQTKEIHDKAKILEYFVLPDEVDQKFTVLGMSENKQSILSRQFTISVLSVIYSVSAVIVMSLFMYVMVIIQEKNIAEQYRQTMNLSVPYGAGSFDRN